MTIPQAVELVLMSMTIANGGCCSSVFCGYVYRELKRHNLSKVLVMATGALMNPMIIEQGESIPAIAHAVAIEI